MTVLLTLAAERAASQKRGGDGGVAEFRGGYLIAGKDAAKALQLAGDKQNVVADSTGKKSQKIHQALDTGEGSEILLERFQAQISSIQMGNPGLSNSRELAQTMCLVWNSDQSSKELGSW